MPTSGAPQALTQRYVLVMISLVLSAGIRNLCSTKHALMSLFRRQPCTKHQSVTLTPRV